MKITTYRQALDFLFAQLPMYSRIGKAALKPSLDNIKALCEALGNPQNDFKSIHVAGTNGKGTVSHLIAGVLQSQGYKVGLHTSPHYVDFRERMKVNGKLPSKSYVKSFLNEHAQLIQDLKPSFFELGVAMSFYHFSQQKVDYAVIEVGLGGRLDSTNIINPLLSVITNISLDHTSILGNTLVEIAGEKAGIIKKGRPVLIGEYQSETINVFKQKAQDTNSKLYLSRDLTSINLSKEGKVLDSYYVSDLDFYFDIDIKGAYNLRNLQTAFAAVGLIPDLQLDLEALREFLSNFRNRTNYKGRWQIIGSNPMILVDSAHNKAGLKFVTDFLSDNKFGQLHIVLGFSDDKIRDDIFPFFPKEAKYYFVKANVPRGLNATTLSDEARQFSLNGKTYKSVKQGLKAAKLSAKSNDLIFVGGSIFVVSEVL